MILSMLQVGDLWSRNGVGIKEGAKSVSRKGKKLEIPGAGLVRNEVKQQWREGRMIDTLWDRWVCFCSLFRFHFCLLCRHRSLAGVNACEFADFSVAGLLHACWGPGLHVRQLPNGTRNSSKAVWISFCLLTF